MPYVTCPTCALSAYSAARVSTRDECARCGTTLPADNPPSPAALEALIPTLRVYA